MMSGGMPQGMMSGRGRAGAQMGQQRSPQAYGGMPGMQGQYQQQAPPAAASPYQQQPPAQQYQQQPPQRGGAPASDPHGAVPVGNDRQVSVAGCSHATVSGIVTGSFTAVTQNHGKPAYKKDSQVNGLDVMLYFWDERDGKAFSGWWFGPKVGGDQVWAYHPSNTMTPPKSGWKVPCDGPVDPNFAVSSGAAPVPSQQPAWGGAQQAQPAWGQQKGAPPPQQQPPQQSWGGQQQKPPQQQPPPQQPPPQQSYAQSYGASQPPARQPPAQQPGPSWGGQQQAQRAAPAPATGFSTPAPSAYGAAAGGMNAAMQAMQSQAPW
ncbi:unnamed protein product, partial [Prorocentrum cordatum]